MTLKVMLFDDCRLKYVYFSLFSVFTDGVKKNYIILKL